MASKLAICMGVKMKAIKHFITITKHRMMVMKYCFNVGLYKQGLLHDLSKYSIVEFLVGCKYYQGTRSPNNAEREMIGYSSAWLNHKGRNKHHSEYWIDYGIGKEPFTAIKMPKKYVAEMLMDRISASRVYEGDKYTCRSPLNYYQHGRGVVVMHEETREMLELLLHKLADEGEEEVIRFVKYEFLKEKLIIGEQRESQRKCE